MTARRFTPPETTPAEARRARVLPQVDRAQRIAAMLERWETEDVADEPDWDVATVESLRLRSRFSGS
jgi:hypothetical protein